MERGNTNFRPNPKSRILNAPVKEMFDPASLIVRDWKSHTSKICAVVRRSDTRLPACSNLIGLGSRGRERWPCAKGEYCRRAPG